MNFSLGRHSTSLAVKNIARSKEFYEKLGFAALSEYGSIEEKWLILQKEGITIGLFQDMFEDNIITFNPTDVRSVYKHLVEQQVNILTASDTINDEKGICHFMVSDPDGNTILFDQHNE